MGRTLGLIVLLVVAFFGGRAHMRYESEKAGVIGIPSCQNEGIFDKLIRVVCEDDHKNERQALPPARPAYNYAGQWSY